MHVAPGGLRQRHRFDIRQPVKLHIPALRMRRKNSMPCPAKCSFRAGTQLPGLVRVDFHIRQQHQLLALQTQMHRIGAQPVFALSLNPSNAASGK